MIHYNSDPNLMFGQISAEMLYDRAELWKYDKSIVVSKRQDNIGAKKFRECIAKDDDGQTNSQANSGMLDMIMI